MTKTAVLRALVSQIDVTGGVMQISADPQHVIITCDIGDPELGNLARIYLDACRVLGRSPKVRRVCPDCFYEPSQTYPAHARDCVGVNCYV